MAPPSESPRREVSEIAGLVSRARIGELCADLHRERKRIVFTNGCFDLVHPGHVLYLAEAAALGDILIVGLNSDLSVHALKGSPRPVVEERGRAIVLLGLRSVSLVSVFDEPTPLELIRVVLPDILVKGGDYRPEEVVGREVVEAHGGSVRIVPFHPGYSSSSLVRRIREGLAPDAAGQA
jgi:D-beta-D-heptose 7-phosphate kinase/D-beta-D-heptose 1-phosphate adenosyltransferase